MMLCLHEKRRCATFSTLGCLDERLFVYLPTLVENQKRLWLSFVTLGEHPKRHFWTFQRPEGHNQHLFVHAQPTECREVMLEVESKTTEGYLQPLFGPSQRLPRQEKLREGPSKTLVVPAETTEGERERRS
jgi:hypothetical protein